MTIRWARAAFVFSCTLLVPLEAAAQAVEEGAVHANPTTAPAAPQRSAAPLQASRGLPPLVTGGVLVFALGYGPAVYLGAAGLSIPESAWWFVPVIGPIGFLASMWRAVVSTAGGLTIVLPVAILDAALQLTGAVLFTLGLLRGRANREGRTSAYLPS